MRSIFYCFSIFALTAFSVAFASENEIHVVNGTGKQITGVYLSNDGENAWGEDVLGWDPHPPVKIGSNTVIKAPLREWGCRLDIRVTYSDDTDAEWWKINLCSAKSVTLHWNDATNKGWVERH